MTTKTKHIFNWAGNFIRNIKVEPLDETHMRRFKLGKEIGKDAFDIVKNGAVLAAIQYASLRSADIPLLFLNMTLSIIYVVYIYCVVVEKLPLTRIRSKSAIIMFSISIVISSIVLVFATIQFVRVMADIFLKR